MNWAVGELGIFGVAPNLISDKKTGLGGRTEEPIATAPTTGKQPAGRIPAPIMPRRLFAKMTKSHVAALVAYLRSLPPVKISVRHLRAKRKAAYLCKAIGAARFRHRGRHGMTIRM